MAEKFICTRCGQWWETGELCPECGQRFDAYEVEDEFGFFQWVGDQEPAE